MDKVYTAWFKVDDEDRYLYLPEREIESWKDMEGFEIEETPCFCLEEAELKPEHDVMLKMMKIIRRRSLQEIKKSEADEHGYKLLRASVRYYSISRKERDKAWLIKKATPYSINMDLKAVKALILNDLKEYYNSVMHIEVYNGIGVLLTTPEKKMKWHKEKKMRASDRTEKRGAEYVQYGYLDELDKYGIPYTSDVIFDIEEISYNYGAGYYEVAYWATAPI